MEQSGTAPLLSQTPSPPHQLNKKWGILLLAAFFISLVATIIVLRSPSAELSVPNSRVNSENEIASNLPVPTMPQDPNVFANSLQEATSPTPVSFNNWSTYISKLYDYSISYPPGWTAQVTVQTDPLILEYVVFNPPNAPASTNAITLSYGTRTLNQALIIYSQQGSPISVGSQNIASTIKTLQNSDGDVSYQVIIPDQEDTVIIYASENYKAILNQMLSNFQIVMP